MARPSKVSKKGTDRRDRGHQSDVAVWVDGLEERFAGFIAGGLVASQRRQPDQRWVCRWSLSLARRMALAIRARRAPGGAWAR
jgi:hypothetical protein